MLTPANDNPAHPSPAHLLALRIGALHGWWRNLVAAMFGVLATLALPPFYAIPLLPVAFCGLYWLLVAAGSSRRSGLDGWWFGVGHFATGLYWIANALLVDAERFGWLVPFAAVGISGGLALFPAIAGMYFFRFRHLGGFRGIWLFALYWLVIEWLRGHLFTGFPWNLTGYVWSFSDVTVQLYAYLGIYLTGFVTVLISLVPAALISGASRRVCALAVAAFVCLLLLGYERLESAPQETVPGIMLRLVQPNIPQTLKWDPDYQMEGLQKLAALSVSEGKERVTHIIWPESAMPFMFRSGDVWAKRLAELVPPGGVLLTGVTRASGTPKSDDFHLYNSLQAVDDQGRVLMAYNKAKLVPFGEFVPFRDILPIEKITHGSLDFTAGKKGQSYNPGGLPPFRPLICYEAIFPELSGSVHPAWLLNITNDAWFGDSTGPRQHLEMARARAVEQGVSLVRAANTGISVVVDAYGRVLKALPLGSAGVIDSPLPKATPQPTIFAYYGGLLYTLFALASVLMLAHRTKFKEAESP